MHSASCQQVAIDGQLQTVAIINKSNLATKKICAMPGEHLHHGGIVDFFKNKWLITEVDVNNEIYERGLMKQCNYLLKWINVRGELIEKWCVVEDGTKYLIGEHAEEMMTIGDARIGITLSRDIDTIALKRGRRFLIDDPDASNPIAYQITKLNKLYNVYNTGGVFRFILTEVELTKYDNVELRIADYYNWTPLQSFDSDHVDTGEKLDNIVKDAIANAGTPVDNGKEVWL